MKRIALVLALAFSGAVLASPLKIPPPKLFAVGMRAPAKVLRGSSTVTSSASLQLARQGVTLGNDGSAQINIVYITPGGQQIVTRQLSVAPGCGVVTDSFGTVLAAVAPAALCTAITTFTTQLDALLGSAAAANKLNL